MTVFTYASHSRANPSGVSDEKRFFSPFLARRCSFTKSKAGTVSQCISVNSSSFMSRAMTLPPSAVTRSTRVHMAGEGICTSSPVRAIILRAYAMSSSLTSASPSRVSLALIAWMPSMPMDAAYDSYPP